MCMGKYEQRRGVRRAFTNYGAFGLHVAEPLSFLDVRIRVTNRHS